MFLSLFLRNEEYRSGSDVPPGTGVGTHPQKQGKALDTPREVRPGNQHFSGNQESQIRLPSVQKGG